MPDVFQLSMDEALKNRGGLSAGDSAVLLFGISEAKDDQASGAYAEDGVFKMRFGAQEKTARSPVITDVCLSST